MRRQLARKRRASGEPSRNGTNLPQIEPASTSVSHSDQAHASGLGAEDEHLWEDLKIHQERVKSLIASTGRLEATFGDLKSDFRDLVQAIRNTNPAVDRRMGSVLHIDMPTGLKSFLSFQLIKDRPL